MKFLLIFGSFFFLIRYNSLILKFYRVLDRDTLFEKKIYYKISLKIKLMFKVVCNTALMDRDN